MSVQNRVKRFSTLMQQNNEMKYLEASVDEIWQNFSVGSRSLLPNEKRSNPNTHVGMYKERTRGPNLGDFWHFHTLEERIGG